MNRDRVGGGRRLAASEGGNGGSGPEPSGQGGRERTRGRAGAAPKSRSWFMNHKIVTFGILPVAAVILVMAGVIANALLNPVNVLVPNRTPVPADTDPADTAAPGGSAGATDGAQPTDAAEVPPTYQFPKDVVNILVLGTDAGLSRGQTGGRTDCIILVSVNLTTKAVTLISTPRDTYVKIYSDKGKIVGHNRINTAFRYGSGLKENGIQYAVNTVSHFLCNVPIDHYVLFNMDLVKDLIDAVGGVTVDVKLREPLDFKELHLESGVQRLNGYAALTYARDRDNTAGGDLGRVGHQQDVMIALLKELKNQNKVYSMIPQLYQTFSKNIVTDLSIDQIASLAWTAKDVSIDTIQQYTIPGENLYMNGNSLVICTQQDKIDILTQIFGTDAGLNLKINSDETHDYLLGLIKKQFQSGQTIVSNAKKLLNDNTAYYSKDEAADLRAAITAWEKASKEQNADDMEEAQQDVQTEYDALSSLIDSRKSTATEEPTNAPTQGPTDSSATQTPAHTSTQTATQTPVQTSTQPPAQTQSSAPSTEQQPPTTNP